MTLVLLGWRPKGGLIVVAAGAEIEAGLLGESIVLVDALHGDVGGFDELHLLGFAGGEGDGAVEVVEVEVVEGLLGDSGFDGYGLIHGVDAVVHGGCARRHVAEFGDVSGHKLDARFGEVGARVVLDGYPAGEIDGFGANGTLGFGRDDVVSCLPCHAMGDVGEFGGEGASVWGR